MVPPRNGVRETSAEIPCWWRVTTQTRVVLLIGWKPASTNQKHALPSGRVAKCHLFSHAMYQLPSGFEDKLGAGVNVTGKVSYILCPAFCSFDLQGGEWFLFGGIKRWPYDKWTHLGVKSCSSDLRVSEQYDFESYPQLSADLIIWAIQ